MASRPETGQLETGPLETLPLETGRLRLRALGPGDAAALYPTMSDAGAMQYWSRAPFTSIAELGAHFARNADSPWHGWAITRVGDDTAIGFASAGEKRQGAVTEIGYLLARDAWGDGIAREAIGAVIDHLFARGQRRVCADTDPDNMASNRLLERLGFQREALLRAEWETHIGVRDSIIWGLLRDEWRGSRVSS